MYVVGGTSEWNFDICLAVLYNMENLGLALPQYGTAPGKN